MSARNLILATILLTLLAHIPSVLRALDDMYLGCRQEKYALVCNTWNDFPGEGLKDVDAQPAQALQAYEALKSRGYSDGEITLMVYHTGDCSVDCDGDGRDDLVQAEIDYEDGQVTKENLMVELSKIALISGEEAEIVIYLVGHGAYSHVPVLTFEDGNSVSYRELLEWLSPLRSRRVVLLLDFCYSEDFVSGGYPEGACVWAAASGNMNLFYCNWSGMDTRQKEAFGFSGSVFFHPFWSRVAEGGGLKEACEYGRAQLLNWPQVDHTVYRMNGCNLASLQQPGWHVDLGRQFDLSLLSAAITAAATAIAASALAIAGVVALALASWRASIAAQERKGRVEPARGRMTLEEYLKGNRRYEGNRGIMAEQTG